ncbi:keratinocyte-associated protein 3-like isoform X2 [Pundamilia nyererei]|uniref:Keratinocyte-associated protein 3-like isoform X2 n=1 Tax=Pundamilia nyererei TaxID=303518 RepID=A0A9Y3RZ46_9CICH|nr:PREDICTED: keratinocyte-associated protein 3-like isoform X2 [Pundamilia nyererei]
MGDTGLCCDSLQDPKALMKMGLSVILVGHVNFLLGALVHGVVLRYISIKNQDRTMQYAIANVVAITSGMLGVVAGILAIVLSKNKKSKSLSTTLILWVPLIVTCLIQLVFCARCLAVCISFLGLPCCPTRKRPRGRSINAVVPIEKGASPHYSRPPSSYNEPAPGHTEPPRTYSQPPRTYSQPSRRSTATPQRQHRTPTPPQYLPRQDHCLPPSERQPLRQPHRVRSDRERQVTRAGSQQMATEQHRLLQRGALERSSFWI